MFPFFDPKVIRIIQKIENLLARYLLDSLPISDKEGWETYVRPFVNSNVDKNKWPLNLQETLEIFEGNFDYLQRKQGFDTLETKDLIIEMKIIRDKWHHPALFQYDVSENLVDLQLLRKFAVSINGGDEIIREIAAVSEETYLLLKKHE